MSEICFGLIGLGNHAEHNVIPAMESASNVRLEAICLSSEEKAEDAEKKHPDARIFSNMEDFLAQDDLEAVYIATPHQLHVPHAFQTINAGKNVLIEKPLSLSVDGARKLVEAARKNNVLLGVGYQLHQHPGLIKIKSMIQNNELGDVGLIMVNLHRNADWPHNWWRQTLHAGPTALMDLGVHAIDLVLWLKGRPATDVTASVQADEEQNGLVAMVSMILNFDDSTQAVITTSGKLSDSLNQLVVVGSDAQVTASLEWPPSMSAQTICLRKKKGTDTKTVKVDNLFVKQLESFRDALLARKSGKEDVGFSPSGEDNIPVVELSCAAIESINSRRLVRCGDILRVSG